MELVKVVFVCLVTVCFCVTCSSQNVINSDGLNPELNPNIADFKSDEIESRTDEMSVNSDEAVADKVNEDKVISDKENEEKVFSDKVNEDKVISVKVNEDKVISDKENEEKVFSDKVNEEKIISDSVNEDKEFSHKVNEEKVISDKVNEEKVISDKKNVLGDNLQNENVPNTDNIALPETDLQTQENTDDISQNDNLQKQETLPGTDTAISVDADSSISETDSDLHKDETVLEQNIPVPVPNIPEAGTSTPKPEDRFVDTGDDEQDKKDLTPEDEDMVIMKMRELGGILDEKDIAEIVQEQAAEDMGEGIPEETEDLKFEPIPMPTDFDSYDRNGDGVIEMKELTEVTGAFENVADAFLVCDKNADGLIDREEFKHAPWDLSGKPPAGGL